MNILLDTSSGSEQRSAPAESFCLIVLGGSKGKGTPPSASPLEVDVVEVEQKDVPIYSERIGTLDGMVNAEIKRRAEFGRETH